MTESLTGYSRVVRQEYRSVYDDKESRQSFITNVFTCGNGVTNGNGIMNGNVQNGNGIHTSNGGYTKAIVTDNGHNGHNGHDLHSRGAFRARYEAALMLSKGNLSNAWLAAEEEHLLNLSAV